MGSSNASNAGGKLMLRFDRSRVLRRTGLIFIAATIAASPSLAQVIVADAGDDLALECSASPGSPVTLDGLGSTVDGVDATLDSNATFLWQAPGVSFSDDASPTPNATFPPGSTTVTLTVTHTDPITLAVTSAQDTVDVVIADSTPPTLVLVPDPAILWPPNHKLRTVNVVVIATDTCDLEPTVVLTSLSSSESDNGQGDGNTSDDIQGADLGTDDQSFLLRAERSGNGSGRTYSAIYTVTDASENSTDGLATIVVPHDQGDVKSGKASKAAKAAAKAANDAAKAAEKAAKKAAKDAKRAAKAADRGR
jgi:hypothetical protein